MKSTITRLIVMIAVAMVCTFNAASVELTDGIAMPGAMAKDFHVEVDTNKDFYNNREVLKLTVKLLNNSSEELHISRRIRPMPADVADAEIKEVFEGTFDEIAVDVEIMPKKHIVIGYARLIPLYPSPIASAEDAVAPQRIYRLPLFGSTVIPAHSTRIISTANIFLTWPIITPAEIEPQSVPEGHEAELVPAVGRYIVPRPGLYLLECNITRIWGTKQAQAQKIIRIRPRIITPVPVPEPISN